MEFSGRPLLLTSRASLRMCGCAHFQAQLVPKMATLGALWKIWGEADSLG